MNRKLAEHLKVIKDNAVDLISENELEERLYLSFKNDRPLKLKIGFDPTARDIHLGHTVLLRKLRRLQDLGHEVYFIVGDFTAKIGDPSGRNELRPVLSPEEIESNAKTYTSQAFSILTQSLTRIFYNSSWYNDFKLSDFLPLLSSYTVARMLERDDFSQRMSRGLPLSMLEILYPLIQGYDSVRVEADIEFGGTDQKFNLIVGRHIQEFFGQRPQIVITMPLLVGLDGENKMSKSLGNYVGITESPEQIFGKIMSIPDQTMWEYYRLLVDSAEDGIKDMHPKEAKLRLARSIVECYYSSEAAEKQEEEFEKVFSARMLPEEIPEYFSSEENVDLIDVLCESGMVSSRNDARRLLSQGGIHDSSKDEPLKERTLKIPDSGVILKIGKRKFLKILFDSK